MKLYDLLLIAWVVMLVLKLTEVIQVSWWAVNSPLIFLAIVYVLFVIFAYIYIKWG